MCGRTRVSSAPERIEQATGAQRWQDRERYRPSHNVTPGSWTPVLRMGEDGQRMLQSMRWGLVPSFIKSREKPDFWKMFNARLETLDSRASFSRLLPSRRCVVLVDGFYEWKAQGSKKQPYHVSLGEDKLMAFAGLFDVWRGGEEGEPLCTYTIVTCDSSPRLNWLHDRMPVMLTDDAAVDAWLGNGSIGNNSSDKQEPQPAQQEQQQKQLDPNGVSLGSSGGSQPEQSPGKDGKRNSIWFLLNQVCKPCNSEALAWHPVTPEMSNPSYQKQDASKDVRTRKGAISSFFKPSPKKQLQPQEQLQQTATAAAVRNTDDEGGPTAADEAAAKAAVAAASKRHAGASSREGKKAKTG